MNNSKLNRTARITVIVSGLVATLVFARTAPDVVRPGDAGGHILTPEGKPLTSAPVAHGTSTKIPVKLELDTLKKAHEKASTALDTLIGNAKSIEIRGANDIPIFLDAPLATQKAEILHVLEQIKKANPEKYEAIVNNPEMLKVVVAHISDEVQTALTLGRFEGDKDTGSIKVNDQQEFNRIAQFILNNEMSVDALKNLTRFSNKFNNKGEIETALNAKIKALDEKALNPRTNAKEKKEIEIELADLRAKVDSIHEGNLAALSDVRNDFIRAELEKDLPGFKDLDAEKQREAIACANGGR